MMRKPAQHSNGLPTAFESPRAKPLNLARSIGIATMQVPNSSQSVCPEDEIILLCARGRMEGGEDRLQEVTSRVEDWPRVGHYAEWHGLTPLIYHHLSVSCPDSVPPTVLAGLRESYLLNTRRSLV